MTPEKIKQVVRFYRQRLGVADRHAPEQLIKFGVPGRVSAAAHTAWMCSQVFKFIDEGRIEKAHRWLGFIQGTLWTLGFFSIDELAQHNRPDPQETP